MILSIRLASDIQVELDTPLAGLDSVAAWLGGGWPSAFEGRPTAHMRVHAEPNAAAVRLEVGARTKGLVWKGDHGQVEHNRGRGRIRLAAGGTAQIVLEVDPTHAYEPTLRMLRMTAELLLVLRGAVLLHAGAVVVDGRAWLFLGDSGAGKTTTARRLGREGALRIADDSVILRFGDKLVEAYVLDRGGRLPDRRGRLWPLGGALQVEKGAARSSLAGPVPDPLRTWMGAVFAPSLPSSARLALMNEVGRLAEVCPPQRFLVAPSGRLRHAMGVSGSGASSQ